MPPSSISCPHIDLRSSSVLTGPYPLFLIQRFFYLLRTRGLMGTLDRVRCVWNRKLGRKTVSVPRTDDVLGLHPGDLVEVKSEHEIRELLDENGAFHGLVFLDGMRGHCGKQFRVHKRLERMFLEESKEFRRLKNTVLLEGVLCDGAGIGCDRSCFLFWREAWLKRVEPRVQ